MNDQKDKHKLIKGIKKANYIKMHYGIFLVKSRYSKKIKFINIKTIFN